MAHRKGERIGANTMKIWVCDRCGFEEELGAIPLGEAARVASRSSWTHIKNGVEDWNICPTCSTSHAKE